MSKAIRDNYRYAQKKAGKVNYEWYTVRSILGNYWAYFYILLGGREAGKSYSVMRFFIDQWKNKGKPFTWLRLKESSQKKLLKNNAMDLVDADIRRDYDLDLTTKGSVVLDHGKPMCRVLALSTFYNDKGVAMFDNDFNLGYNICLDEMNKEKNERNDFDIAYAFVNQMENLVRSTKEKLNIFLIGNTLEEASDILCLFNFIPEEFGRYYVRKKKAVIDYMPPTEKYLQRRKGTVADILAPTSSTFTNQVDVDTELVKNVRNAKPSYVIMFSKDKKDWFTVWNSRMIAQYNGEQVNKIPMRPYLDVMYDTEQRDTIIAMFDARAYWFKTLFAQKLFKKNLELLKPRQH